MRPALPAFRGLLAAVTIASLASAIVVRRGSHLAAQFLEPHRHAIPGEARAEAFRVVPDLRDVTMHTSDGLTLRGWLSPGTRHAVVILIHGQGGDRSQLLPEALVLSRHGYGFLAYDSRAHGESDGDRTTWGDGERRDVAAALDLLMATPQLDPRLSEGWTSPPSVALLGFSIGGTTATLVAARDPRVRAVIANPVWTSLEDEVRSKSGRLAFLTEPLALFALRHGGIDVDAVRPIDHVADIAPRPLLLIAGTQDRDTPVVAMQRMFDAARSPKSLWVVPGAGHGESLKTAPAEYEARVVAFLDSALGVVP
jgi:pimeloyl-ACP methyl ester carboxylesterase